METPTKSTGSSSKGKSMSAGDDIPPYERCDVIGDLKDRHLK